MLSVAPPSMEISLASDGRGGRRKVKDRIARSGPSARGDNPGRFGIMAVVSTSSACAGASSAPLETCSKPTGYLASPPLPRELSPGKIRGACQVSVRGRREPIASAGEGSGSRRTTVHLIRRGGKTDEEFRGFSRAAS